MLFSGFDNSDYHRKIVIDSHVVAVGSVAFDGDDREPVPGDEAHRQLCAPAVEFRDAMRRFAQQDVLRVADRLDEPVEFGRPCGVVRLFVDSVAAPRASKARRSV